MTKAQHRATLDSMTDTGTAGARTYVQWSSSSIRPLLDLSHLPGDFDEGLHDDWIKTIILEARKIAPSIIVYPNGLITCEINDLIPAHEISWEDLVDEIDVDEVLERHRKDGSE